MRNECRKTKELISGYVNGNLEPRERTFVAEHVLVCDHCRQELDQMRLLLADLRQLSDEKAPEDIWAAISGRIGARPVEHKHNYWHTLRWGALTIPAAAAAIIFITMRAPEQRKPAPAPAQSQQMASAEYQAYIQAYSKFRSTQTLSDRATIPAATQLQRREAVPH